MQLLQEDVALLRTLHRNVAVVVLVANAVSQPADINYPMPNLG